MYQASAPPPHAPQPYAQPSYPPPPYAQPPYPPQPYPQPPYATPQHRGPPGRIQREEWSSGLCDCFKDCHNCFITHWCPCITFGRIAEIVDKGSPSCEASGAMYCLIASVTGHAWIYSCFYRSKLRAQYALPESPCPDFLVHCCCEWCALCQEYRELKSRGFDMSIGWEENQQIRRREMAMAPMPQGGMTR